MFLTYLFGIFFGKFRDILQGFYLFFRALKREKQKNEKQNFKFFEKEKMNFEGNFVENFGKEKEKK